MGLPGRLRNEPDATRSGLPLLHFAQRDNWGWRGERQTRRFTENTARTGVCRGENEPEAWVLSNKSLSGSEAAQPRTCRREASLGSSEG